jgi:F420-non-reducing hydrogenase small subunit
VNIVFWPVALDFKEKDVEAMEDGSIDISFVNGAVRTGEQLKMARLMRRKSKLVVAFGACAHTGGIPGLANLTTARDILREAYGESAPQEEFRVNGHTLKLPGLFDTVLPLDAAIPVEYYVPGCPPSRNVVAEAFRALLSDSPPPPGTVLAPDRALCDECPRKDTRPEDLSVERFFRPQDKLADVQTCLLAQGFPCLGAATRAGCGARCIAGNMPCTGCFGASSRVRDYGAKALSMVASVAAGSEDQAIERVLEGITDPAGTFYRYSLPASFLKARRAE